MKGGGASLLFLGRGEKKESRTTKREGDLQIIYPLLIKKGRDKKRSSRSDIPIIKKIRGGTHLSVSSLGGKRKKRE